MISLSFVLVTSIVFGLLLRSSSYSLSILVYLCVCNRLSASSSFFACLWIHPSISLSFSINRLLECFIHDENCSGDDDPFTLFCPDLDSSIKYICKGIEDDSDDDFTCSLCCFPDFISFSFFPLDSFCFISSSWEEEVFFLFVFRPFFSFFFGWVTVEGKRKIEKNFYSKCSYNEKKRMEKWTRVSSYVSSFDWLYVHLIFLSLLHSLLYAFLFLFLFPRILFPFGCMSWWTTFGSQLHFHRMSTGFLCRFLSVSFLFSDG